MRSSTPMSVRARARGRGSKSPSATIVGRAVCMRVPPKRKAPNTGGRVFGAVGTWVRSVLQWTAVHTRAQYVKRSGCGACAGVAPTRGIPQVVSRRRGLDIPSDGREDFIGRDLRRARAPARLDLEPA